MATFFSGLRACRIYSDGALATCSITSLGGKNTRRPSTLQPPFFNIEADDAVNYGAIGAVIGHEIGHGFDDQGSKSDGTGKLRNWWTDEDRANFDERGDGVTIAGWAASTSFSTGGLIHACCGTVGGCGGRRTKRSGFAR